ncbi:MAG TPA: MFS transporter [Gaiellaceae bacterium]|nr:MFS transporter [Gaiellaceae bacterium]
MLRAQRRQLQLLRRGRDFRALFLAALASGLGTWLAVIALTVDVFDRTHSATWVSALLIADFLPAVVIGLTAGPLVDRLSRRGLMLGADLARALVFAALPFADTPGQIVGLAAVAGFATGVFRPAVFAGLPNLVDEPDLPGANALLRLVETMTMTVGTLLGGIAAAASGPHLAYWLNAASFLLSFALVAGIASDRFQSEPSDSRGHLSDMQEGFATVRRSPALLTVFVVWNLVLFPSGAVNVAEVELAKVSFDAGSLGFGLLWTATGIGQALGSLFAPSWLERRGMRTVYAGAVALMGFGALAAAGSPDVWVALWCVALSGAGNGAAHVYNVLLVQRGAPDRVRGRAFTVIMSATFAAFGVGMIVGGPLTDAVGPRWVYAGAGVLTTGAAAAGALLTRRIRAAIDAAEPEARPASAVG